MTFVCTLFVLSLAACANVIVVDSDASTNGFALKEAEFENARFIPGGFGHELISSIRPAKSFWLKKGEEVMFRWDTFETHWQAEGKICGFENNNVTDDCKICDLCNLPSSPTPFCPSGGRVFPGSFTLVTESSFVHSDTPSVILDYAGVEEFQGLVAQTCEPTIENPANLFEPQADGLYRFKVGTGWPTVFKGDMKGEAIIHIVKPGAPQTVAFQLENKTVDGASYWLMSLKGDPIWLENFSPNVLVTEIRLFRGECMHDLSTGRSCVVPSGAESVKPSRLLYLPNFVDTVSNHQSEDNNRCYARPAAVGGTNFLLGECRNTYSTDPQLSTEAKFVTPSYSIEDEGAVLTWVIQFNTAEGATAVSDTEDLIIEFTISAG